MYLEAARWRSFPSFEAFLLLPVATWQWCSWLLWTPWGPGGLAAGSVHSSPSHSVSSLLVHLFGAFCGSVHSRLLPHLYMRIHPSQDRLSCRERMQSPLSDLGCE